MTPRQLAVNRWLAEQALQVARRYRDRLEVKRAQRILDAIDRLKSVARHQRLTGSGHGVEGLG